MLLNELDIAGTDISPILRADPERINSIDNWFGAKGFQEITSGINATSYIYVKPGQDYVIKFTHTPDPCYMRFVAYVDANSSNPHLPKITKMLRFKQDPNYILIGIEKLEEANFEGTFEGRMMWAMQHAIDVAIFKNTRDDEYLPTTVSKELADAIKHMKLDIAQAKDVLRQNYPLFKTVMDIKRRLTKGDCRYDLHPDNFMKRKDGTIVIIDPLI